MEMCRPSRRCLTPRFTVLGNDGNLWLEHGPFGTVPPKRQLVAGSVKAFEFGPIPGSVFVLGTDGNLWIAKGLPPGQPQVDSNVSGFEVFWDNPNMALVLKTDGNLWLEQGSWFGNVPTSRQQVDGNVALSPP